MNILEQLKEIAELGKLVPQCIPASQSDKRQACKITKVGKLHKAKRVIQITEVRENLEAKMMQLARREGAKELRATNQREQRRAKR